MYRRISACGTGEAPTRSGSSAADSSASLPPQAASRAVAAEAARMAVKRVRMAVFLLGGGVWCRRPGGRREFGSGVRERARPAVPGPLEGLDDDEQQDDGR